MMSGGRNEFKIYLEIVSNLIYICIIVGLD